MRDESVNEIYVVFGKGGGEPEVRWSRYQDCVIHVRVSTAPRFVVNMDSDEPSLFDRFDIAYNDFAGLDDESKMQRVRDYWRGRLQHGEHLWWLEPTHTLPINVRLYTHLSQPEKRMMRAEAALLCPQVCKGPRSKGKYEEAVIYLLTCHGVLCPQSRDLFSAGIVALRSDGTRGGNYVQKALLDIEDLMRDAAKRLDDALFAEYWGEPVQSGDRLAKWFRRADSFAVGWQPSDHLFLDLAGSHPSS